MMRWRSLHVTVLSLFLIMASACDAALQAPTSLTVIPVSGSSVMSVSWLDSNRNETGFAIERSVNGVSFAQVATVGRNVTNIQNVVTACGARYYYRVRATKGGSASPYSNVASAIAADTVPPSQPPSLSALAVSCSQINLSWGTSTDACGVTKYRLYRNGAFWKDVTGAVSTSDTGRAGATTYTYAVYAMDNAGNLSSGRGASATTPSCSAPTTTPTTSSTTTTLPGSCPAPSGLSASPASCSQINLAWTAASTSSCGGLRGYNIYRNGVFLRQVPASPSADTGLAASTLYSYQVSAAYNSGPESTKTNTASANTPACPVSGSGAFQWNKRFGGTVGSASAYANATATDRNGNVFVVGQFQGTVDFGGGSVTCQGGQDGFVAKYSASGAHLWSRRLGGTPIDMARGVAVDSAGNVIVTGMFDGNGSSDFGGGALTSAGATDIFVAKYSSAGAYMWAKRLGGTASDAGYAVAVDGSDNILLTGYFQSTVNFGGSVLTSVGSTDVFVVKLSPAGAHVWSRRGGSSGFDSAESIAADSTGNAIVTGYFPGTADFGGGSLATLGGNDVFVAKYASSNGAHLWSRRAGGTTDDRAYGVAVDGAGNVIVVGSFTGSASFGGTTLVAGSGGDLFIAKYSSSGVHQWSKGFGGSVVAGQVASKVATDPSGNIVMTGSMAAAINFGGGTLYGGSPDVFVVKFTGAGAHLWSKRAGVLNPDHGMAITTDPSGNVIAVGDFYEGVDFGGGMLSSPGGIDTFVVKFSP